MDTPGLGLERISGEQALQLAELHFAIDLTRDQRHGFTELAARMASLLSADVTIFGRRDRQWRVVAESNANRPRFPMAIAATVFAQLRGPECRLEDGAEWTLLPCHVGDATPAVLVVRGDWTPYAPLLVLMARNVSLALTALKATSRARLRLETHRLARLLSRATGLSHAGRIIITHMAHAVDARLSALAIPNAMTRELSIVATYGYPLTLVEHVRIEPGAGVLGMVFDTGRPMLARSADVFPEGRHRRPRYRTDSFVAVPIVADREVVAVACATDRRNDAVFTRRELSALRALAAPAGLSLSRERARMEAVQQTETAAIDPVSGVFNRRHFHVRLQEELERARRHGIPLALLMVDVDDFKLVNDSFGHLAGDAVLKEVAEILRRSTRAFDVCARFGGDEFAIIMPGSPSETAGIVAGRVRQRVEEHRWGRPTLAALRVTVSVGLAISAVDMLEGELIARADHALYAAKLVGKNAVRILDPDDRIDSDSHEGKAERD